MDTLAVQLTIPLVGFVGDFHSLVRTPCRAHKTRGAHGGTPLQLFTESPASTSRITSRQVVEECELQ
jgi:hypothetical protein